MTRRLGLQPHHTGIDETQCWVNTERGLKPLDQRSDLGQEITADLAAGILKPGDKQHIMRAGSILVASSATFAFHPEDVARKVPYSPVQ